MMTIAIDPGASGGLAWRDTDGQAQSCKMPATEGDVVDLLRHLSISSPATAYVEKVGGFTGQGQPGSAMFNFGRGVGVLHGALLALGVRVIEVTPQKWQGHIGIGTSKGSASKAAWKNRLKAEAQRRFPDQKVTLSTADALLMLEYAQAAGKNA
jgi:hypothetical protein